MSKDKETFADYTAKHAVFHDERTDLIKKREERFLREELRRKFIAEVHMWADELATEGVTSMTLEAADLDFAEWVGIEREKEGY